MLASIYTDDFERGNAMGIALGGLALGVLSKDILLPRGFAPAAPPSHAAFGGLSIPGSAPQPCLAPAAV